MTDLQDLENARRYIWALVHGNSEEMDEAVRPYRDEGANQDQLVQALARMVILQAGPRPDLDAHLDQLVRALSALARR
ncbi:MAG: hypothetical protein M3360_06690 [Actinomycetota bacterium]|nr:hypothetical protein [Actinomycetota bacterium]